MLTLVIAFLSDLVMGDPVYRFHPVRLMGRAIQEGESFLRQRVRREKVAGAILAFTLPLLVLILTWCVIFSLAKIHVLLGWAATLFGIYSALSVRDLKKEGFQVYQDLMEGDREKARRDLARIVGRDTAGLDEMEIIRASIETIAESTMDGIVAPLFYAAIGGAPLALAYKAVNTLDSMVGYRSERYCDFGFVAAKQDEFWNWVPARLSYLAIAFAAGFLKWRAKEAWAAGWRDGLVAGYGNSAIPEATFAGALGLRLGGISTYEGRPAEKPFLGCSKKDFDREDLARSLKLTIAASWISLLGALALQWGVHFATHRFGF